MKTPKGFFQHGGGVAPVWLIRVADIAAVSCLYGDHGEGYESNGRKGFGPFVDVYLSGGQKITLENCTAGQFGHSYGTQEMIANAMNPEDGE